MAKKKKTTRKRTKKGTKKPRQPVKKQPQVTLTFTVDAQDSSGTWRPVQSNNSQRVLSWYKQFGTRKLQGFHFASRVSYRYLGNSKFQVSYFVPNDEIDTSIQDAYDPDDDGNHPIQLTGPEFSGTSSIISGKIITKRIV